MKPAVAIEDEGACCCSLTDKSSKREFKKSLFLVITFLRSCIIAVN